MKFKNILLAFCGGITFSVFFSIMIAFSLGNKEFLLSPPILSQNLGGTLNAALIQTLASGILGIYLFSISKLFDKLNSLLIASITHFVLTFLGVFSFMLLITQTKILSINMLYFTINFFIIYLIIFIFMYLYNLYSVKKINTKIKNK